MPKTVNGTLLTELQAPTNEPVYLVEIALTGVTLRFTDYCYNLYFPSSGGSLYTAWGIDFDKIRNTITSEVDRKKFSFDNTNLVFSTTYLAVYQFQGKILTLKRVVANKLDNGAYVMTLFSGEINAPSVTEEKVEFEVVSPLSKLSKMVPARLFQNQCPYNFDSAECLGGGSSLADSTNGTADSGDYEYMIDGARTEDDGYWDGGTLEMTSGTNNGLTTIIKTSIKATRTILLKYNFPSEIAVNDTYTIKRGCNKTSRDCKFKFDNWVNFGGFTTLPVKD